MNEKKSLSSKSIQIHLKQEYSCAVCASAEESIFQEDHRVTSGVSRLYRPDWANF